MNSFMQTSLFDHALQLLIFGMGTVFVFLILLVVAVNLMSRFVQQYFPEPIALEPHPLAPETDSSKGHTDLDPVTLAAIQAAIHLHRNKRQ